jgi:formylglycine-generating enzyme required for sulfatase activity
MSWSAENSQDVGLRLVEELPIAAERPERVLRGGSWDFDPQNARVADRDSFSPGYRDGNLGFRLVEVTDD